MKNGPAEHGEAWISGHLYHHENLERVVRGFVHPLAASLSAEGWITGFFFIRYGVGGPHIRLRLQPVEEKRDWVLERMRQSAQEFLAREPSTRSLDVEKIRRGTEASLKKDPHEVDASVYPDNSFHVLPFRPEVERYGGPSRIGFSLDFFTLSSVAVLDHLSNLQEVKHSVRLAKAYELLLRQALAFAADASELSDLSRYGVDWFGQQFPKVAEKGESVARSQMPLFSEVFRESSAETRSLFDRHSFESSPMNLLVAGARRLSMALEDLDRPTRFRIGASQIHMTASRLGLSNPEEVYLSRISSLVLDHVQADAAGDLLRPLGAGSTGESLRGLLPAALATLERESERE